MHVRLRNERTGELKEVKVGFSWTLLLFSNFLGIPLFLRRLTVWGGAMFALCIFYWVLNYIPMGDEDQSFSGSDMLFVVVNFVALGLAIFFGVKGNELTAKNLLENGWQFADPEDASTEFAKSKWSLG